MEGDWGAVLMVVVIGFLVIQEVEGRSTAQCVQVGQSPIKINGKGAFSIGGKMLEPSRADLLEWNPLIQSNNISYYIFYNEEEIAKGSKTGYFKNMTCKDGGYKLNVGAAEGNKVIKNVKGKVSGPATEYCSDKVELRVYLVRQNEIVLRGWLYVEVELTEEADKAPALLQDGQQDWMEFIYVQVRDEAFNAIGEFVSPDEMPDGEQCQKQSKQALIRPSPLNLLPCSATGMREAKTSGAIFVASKNQYVNLKDMDRKYFSKDGDGNLRRGIRFMWRLNEYWCNRHERIRIDVFTWTQQNDKLLETNPKCYQLYGREKAKYNISTFNNAEAETWKDNALELCRTYQKTSDWFKLKWFGAADIKTPGQKLDCTIRINEDGKTAIPGVGQNWLEEQIIPSTTGTDIVTVGYMKNKDVYTEAELATLKKNGEDNYLISSGGIKHDFIRGCQVSPIPKEDNIAGIETFGGRCKGHYTKEPKKDNYQNCSTDGSLPQFINFKSNWSSWDTYRNYTQTIETGRRKACSEDCVDLSKDKDDTYFKEIKGIQPPTSGGNGTAEAKVSQRPVSGKVLIEARRISREITFWQVRKYHGNLCIFFTMFIIPVCLFITRYYKETFMHGRCASCPPWLWIHLFMCISVLTLFRSTFSAMRETIYSWGRQLDGDSEGHRFIGYVFVGLFSLMTAIGGLRPIPRIPRLITCAVHSVVGFVLYLIALELIMHSPMIPGSPSKDYCNDESANNSNRPDPRDITHRVTIYASVWLVLDIIFHAALTIFQVIIDKQTGIERPGFGLPFIPFLPPNANRDYQGALVRKIVLVLYVIVSFIMTVVTMTDIFDNDLDNPNEDHKFCKPWNVTTCNIRDNPFGCTDLQKRYFNIVSSRYNITWDD